MTVLNIVLLVGVVVYVVVRRMVGEPLNARDVYVPPLVLVGLGVHTLTELHLTSVDLLWLAVTCAVGVGFGALRASTTRLFARDGVLWQRYTWRTLVVWVVTAAAGFGLGALAIAAGMHEEARPMTLSIGIGLLGEAAVLWLRAQSLGVPYAPDRR